MAVRGVVKTGEKTLQHLWRKEQLKFGQIGCGRGYSEEQKPGHGGRLAKRVARIRSQMRLGREGVLEDFPDFGG